MKNRKVLTIIAASFALFGVAACKPLPASIDQIVNSVDAPAPDPNCPTVASCLPQSPPPPTTEQPCGTTEANPCQPDPACPTVASCLPQGSPPPTTEQPCGTMDSNPCPPPDPACPTVASCLPQGPPPPPPAPRPCGLTDAEPCP